MIFMVYNVINKINMSRIDNIIQKTISECVNREILSESVLDDIKNLLKAYKGKSNLSSEDLRKERQLKKKAEKEKKETKKFRRTKNGGKMYYDYNDYERKHRYSVDLNMIKDKVALYGSGVVGQSIYEQLRTNDRTSVVVWTDQKILCKEGIMDTVANLVKYDFDQIIIAVKSKMAVNDIMHELALLGYDEKIMYWEEF